VSVLNAHEALSCIYSHVSALGFRKRREQAEISLWFRHQPCSLAIDVLRFGSNPDRLRPGLLRSVFGSERKATRMKPTTRPSAACPVQYHRGANADSPH
jgi:hypothetical protein